MENMIRMYHSPFENLDPNLPPKGFGTIVNVYQNAPAQVIPNAVTTRIRLDLAQYDRLGEFNLALYDFTPKKAGYYYIYGQVCASAPIAQAPVLFRIYEETAIGTIAFSQKFIRVNDVSIHQTQTIYFLDPSAAITLRIWQATGFNLTLVSGLGYTFMIVHRIA